MVETAALLLSLCGPGAVGLAPHFQAAAHRYHIPPVILIAQARVESTCHPNAVGGKDGINVGLLAIRVGASAAHGHTAEELKRPRLNLLLGARHLRKTWDLCHDLAGGLGVYAGYRTCSQGRRSSYSRKVLSWVEEVERGTRS
jgi:hypothetical protein